MNYDDVAGCKCDRTASSSARFQSSANAASLKSVVSLSFGSPSRMVTSARRGDWTRTGSTNRTSPLGRIIASTVLTFLSYQSGWLMKKGYQTNCVEGFRGIWGIGVVNP
jgi:hypothetical protein